MSRQTLQPELLHGVLYLHLHLIWGFFNVHARIAILRGCCNTLLTYHCKCLGLPHKNVGDIMFGTNALCFWGHSTHLRTGIPLGILFCPFSDNSMPLWWTPLPSSLHIIGRGRKLLSHVISRHSNVWLLAHVRKSWTMELWLNRFIK